MEDRRVEDVDVEEYQVGCSICLPFAIYGDQQKGCHIFRSIRNLFSTSETDTEEDSWEWDERSIKEEKPTEDWEESVKIASTASEVLDRFESRYDQESKLSESEVNVDSNNNTEEKAKDNSSTAPNPVKQGSKQKKKKKKKNGKNKRGSKEKLPVTMNTPHSKQIVKEVAKSNAELNIAKLSSEKAIGTFSNYFKEGVKVKIHRTKKSPKTRLLWFDGKDNSLCWKKCSRFSKFSSNSSKVRHLLLDSVATVKVGKLMDGFSKKAAENCCASVITSNKNQVLHLEFQYTYLKETFVSGLAEMIRKTRADKEYAAVQEASSERA